MFRNEKTLTRSDNFPTFWPGFMKRTELTSIRIRRRGLLNAILTCFLCLMLMNLWRAVFMATLWGWLRKLSNTKRQPLWQELSEKLKDFNVTQIQHSSGIKTIWVSFFVLGQNILYQSKVLYVETKKYIHDRWIHGRFLSRTRLLCLF